jgi:hypothetical protein
MNRDKATYTAKELPQEFELENRLKNCFFAQKVQDGLKQLNEGKTVPYEKVKETVKKW